MIEIEVPDFGKLKIEHVVMDYNGTLAVDGILVDGVKERFNELAQQVELHVVTADTFGKAASQLENLPCKLSILPPSRQATAKSALVKQLGLRNVIAIGNGRNDRLLLETAALGIGIILEEGISSEALRAADIICKSVNDALDLLLNPMRLIATLRS